MHATEGTRQREGHSANLGFNLINRSKSSAALPIASGISVTTGGLINSGQSLSPAKDTETKTTPIRGKVSIMWLLAGVWLTYSCSSVSLRSQTRMPTFPRRLRQRIPRQCWLLQRQFDAWKPFPPNADHQLDRIFRKKRRKSAAPSLRSRIGKLRFRQVH